jgi:predicted enzyme related to lactoylglutathione lyase
VRVEVHDVALVSRFYRGIGWEVDGSVVRTPGGSFLMQRVESPPRLELALSVADPLVVDELAFVVEDAGGLLMEPVQETAYGGWGFSFNDPEGSCWEVGAPWSVTAIDLRARGLRSDRRGPIVVTRSLFPDLRGVSTALADPEDA